MKPSYFISMKLFYSTDFKPLFVVKSIISLLFLTTVLACSNSQMNPLIGDYKNGCDDSSSKTSTDCSGASNVTEPSFERNDNSDIILSKIDGMVELSGKCDIKGNPDSEIKISIVPQGYSAVTLTTGFMPIIGITTSGSTQQKPIAKCEKGKWALALNTCANGLQAVGVHRLDLVLSAIDSAGRKVVISDGSISANINRTDICL